MGEEHVLCLPDILDIQRSAALVFFFFSSRRRHTRYIGDWSSDVCSSDLAAATSWTLSTAAGTNTLTATSSGLTGSPVTFTATGTAGAATNLVLTTPPSSSAQSGAPLAQQPVLQLQDANNNPVSQSGVVVTATVTPAGATPTNTTATTGTTGAATFSGLTLSGTAGSYTLSFGATGLTPVTSGTVTLSAGAATQLVLTTQASTAASSGVPLAQQPVVQLQDANGNAVSQSSVVVTATASPTGATASSNTATTGTAGAAMFSGLMLSGTVGSYTLSFGATNLTPVTSGTIMLGAGAAASLSFATQPSNIDAGAFMTPGVQVAALDAAGNRATSFGGTVSVALGTPNPHSGRLYGTTTGAAGGGVAVFSDLTVDSVASGYTLLPTAPRLAAAASNPAN